MILSVAVILSFVWLVTRRGSLRQLGELRLRSWWLAPAAVVVQMLIVATTTDPSDPRQVWLGAIALPLSHAALLVVVWRNRQHWPLGLLGAGVLMNLLVMVANGGYMPVTPETVLQVRPERAASTLVTGERVTRTKDVVLPREETRLWPLSDVLVVEHPPVGFATGQTNDQPSQGSFMSLGDLFVAAGIALLIQTASRVPSPLPDSTAPLPRRTAAEGPVV